MAGFTLKKHMVFDWDGREYRLLELNESGQVLLENTKDGLLEIDTREHLLAEYKAGKVSTNTPGNQLSHAEVPIYSRPLDELSERDKLEIQRRKHYLDRIFIDGKPFFTAQYLNPLIAKAAAEIGDNPPPGYITVYRWYRKFRDSKNIMGLKSGICRRGSRKRKQTELALKSTADGIAETLKQSPLANGNDIYTVVRGKIGEENRKRLPQDQIKPFTKRTLYRMLKTADIYELTVLKEGKAAADRRFRVVMQGVKTKYVLERVEIDHTPLDLFLVDDKTGLPLGRPTLTVVLDHYSRMLLGYYLTFDSPSAAAVMGALRHAILPKTPVDGVLPNLKMNNPWPCFGIPEVTVVDIIPADPISATLQAFAEYIKIKRSTHAYHPTIHRSFERHTFHWSRYLYQSC
ncbi:MAG: hypothetical protein ABL933_10045 [Methyloglobulus sp.]|nr:hypothetical protein [Methyloglobulus sp.]